MLVKFVSHLRQQYLGALALFIVLGGSSYAVATGSIDSREIKNNSVRSQDVRNNELRSKDVRNGGLLSEDFAPGQLPAGPRGVQGPAGPAGPAGSARAYARLNLPCGPGQPQVCPFDQSKGVTRVTRVGAGAYCVIVPGANSLTTAAAVSTDFTYTESPPALGQAMTASPLAVGCPADGFAVLTQRAPASYTNDVGFTIVVP